MEDNRLILFWCSGCFRNTIQIAYEEYAQCTICHAKNWWADAAHEEDRDVPPART